MWASAQSAHFRLHITAPVEQLSDGSGRHLLSADTRYSESAFKEQTMKEVLGDEAEQTSKGKDVKGVLDNARELRSAWGSNVSNDWSSVHSEGWL